MEHNPNKDISDNSKGKTLALLSGKLVSELRGMASRPSYLQCMTIAYWNILLFKNVERN